ncbi:MAG: hypothetical protein AB1726_01590 [Planctomycetota bacterium]
MSIPPLSIGLVLAVLGAGCIASSALDADQRAVAGAGPVLDWHPGTAADVPGLYSSTAISGPAAAVLFEVHYRFDANGSFTGAALVGTPEPQFQVLTGAWRLEGELLYLSGEGEPARLEVAGEHLRLAGAEGTVVLRRRSGG